MQQVNQVLVFAAKQGPKPLLCLFDSSTTPKGGPLWRGGEAFGGPSKRLILAAVVAIMVMSNVQLKHRTPFGTSLEPHDHLLTSTRALAS